ncbi:NAD(P)H-dependent oxidoreductase [Companilactobacillus allii]|uniref:NADPH-dependent FMN reductase n=1 Tax=Companilactobacillus allii TaxID=1847728 RepID=A0A1P8PZZ1_9LACO|nr:NAD(P)H-dependent oxidoreductase [Companilactobacillus allii]APX71121.1 NADPH-dependent FMN reductase [Companilactobacillus allii]USQ68200.1 NAD(P)H-dependent oxidoreductase [Companilactobacillus allii]
MKNIGIIVGSSRPTRVSLSIANWVKDNLDSNSLNFEIIDLKEISLPFLDEPDIPAHGNYQNKHTKDWAKLINNYDGFIIIYPQYNWGYPAVLKNALDYLYKEWAHKPVSSVVYGSHGGFQAEIALDLVLNGLHMNILNSKASLSFDNSKELNPTIDFKKYEFSIKQIGYELESIFNEDI